MPIPLLSLVVVALLLIDWRVAIAYLLVLFVFQSYTFTPDTYWLLQYVDFLPFTFFAVAFFRRLISYDR